MTISLKTLEELTIDDEAAFSHVGIYADLKQWFGRENARFGVIDHDRHDHALVLNLAFWKPGDVAELLADDHITADQLMHNAWHAVMAKALGAGARSVGGLLLAESIASAFDIYLVGRLLGHRPNCAFLETQIPRMAEAAEDAGFSEEAFGRVLTHASAEPEQAFEQLRQLLFDTSSRLVACDDLAQAAEVFAEMDEHPLAMLLHHYELSTWLLFARCYGQGDEELARTMDSDLRGSEDAVRWLQTHCLSGADT